MNLIEIVRTMTVAKISDAQICKATGLTRKGLRDVRDSKEYNRKV